MDSISSLIAGSGAAQSNASASADATPNEVAQEDFLRLMTEQLKAQDPFKPVENGEFLSQLAQFGTVNGIDDLNESFNKLSSALQSSQAYQASALVGREVLVESSSTTLREGQAVQGEVNAGAFASARLNIYSTSGELVHSRALQPDQQGIAAFVWRGETDAGTQAVPGQYLLEVQASNGRESFALTPHLQTQISSVSLDRGSPDLLLNLADRGQVRLPDVLEIR